MEIYTDTSAPIILEYYSALNCAARWCQSTCVIFRLGSIQRYASPSLRLVVALHPFFEPSDCMFSFRLLLISIHSGNLSSWELDEQPVESEPPPASTIFCAADLYHLSMCHPRSPIGQVTAPLLIHEFCTFPNSYWTRTRPVQHDKPSAFLQSYSCLTVDRGK